MDSQICFKRDNFMLFITAGILIIGYAIYTVYVQSQERLKVAEHLQKQLDEAQQQQEQSGAGGLGSVQEFIQNLVTAQQIQRNEDEQRMGNPFVPPVRRGPFSFLGAQLSVPVNTPTRGEYGPFHQMGYLYKVNNPDQAMPLMGRRIHSNQYEYYTFHHNNPNIKIPLKSKGDQELQNGEQLTVTGYPGSFLVQIYDLDYPRYIPY